MRAVLNVATLFLCLTLTKFSVPSSLKENLLSYFHLNQPEDQQRTLQPDPAPESTVDNLVLSKPQPQLTKVLTDKRWAKKTIREDSLRFPMSGIEDDIPAATPRTNLRIFRADDKMDDIMHPEQRIGINNYRVDPVLNYLRRNFGRKPRKEVNLLNNDTSTSSSREDKPWKAEYEEMWLHKKFEAMNQTIARGDQVNMLAARPWGVPCGDPNQYDMPWGSCTMPIECDPEYRIPRGDYFCGQTRFVCCAIVLTTYDLYQGFDISFPQYSTDSDEKRDREKASGEIRKKKNMRDRRKRKKKRKEKLARIKKNIRKIIKEIKSILHEQYRNGTKERKRRVRQLKQFIKDLKRQFRMDRDSIYKLRDKNMLDIDEHLQDRLQDMLDMNKMFVKNHTYRQVVVNGSASQPRAMARILLDSYPELADMINARRQMLSRRGLVSPAPRLPQHEHDVEYGYLYY